MEEKVGLGHLVQRRTEGLHELVRELAHEAHRVGEEHPLAAGQVEAARRGVDGGEQTVLDEHAGVGQAVEQRGLAGVGVADQGDGRQARARAGLALGAPVLGQLAELGLELGHAPEQPAAVDLELGLARSAPADAAAEA